MARAAVVTEAKVERIISAIQKRGLIISECIITPTEVRFLFGEVDGVTEKKKDDGPKKWPSQRG